MTEPYEPEKGTCSPRNAAAPRADAPGGAVRRQNCQSSRGIRKARTICPKRAHRRAGSLRRRCECPARVSGTGESDSFVDTPLKNCASKRVRSRQ